jgi:cytochrome c-type biogenesis protein CcmH
VTTFVFVALLLALLASAFVAWPLVRRRAAQPAARGAALLFVLLLVFASALLYAWRGTNRWVAAGSAQPNQAVGASISTLARRVELEPQDAAGWVELGQAYAELGEFPLALRAYQRANRIDNNANAMALSGIGEAMLLGGDPAQAAQAGPFFERALQIDPRQGRALFYSSITAFREGKLDVARQRSQALLALSPPEVVRTALEQQIAAIDAAQRAGTADQAGTAGAPGASAADPATTIRLHVTLSAALARKVPANAALFVFMRAPDGGPPLAARRGSASFPQDLTLSAADAPMSGQRVQAGQTVSVVARISATGSPLPQSGDLYGEIQAIAGKAGMHALQIDRLSP